MVDLFDFYGNLVGKIYRSSHQSCGFCSHKGDLFPPALNGLISHKPSFLSPTRRFCAFRAWQTVPVCCRKAMADWWSGNARLKKKRKKWVPIVAKIPRSYLIRIISREIQHSLILKMFHFEDVFPSEDEGSIIASYASF